MDASTRGREGHSFIHFILSNIGMKDLRIGIILRKAVRTYLQTTRILEHGFPHVKSGICVFLVFFLLYLKKKNPPELYEIKQTGLTYKHSTSVGYK